MIAPGLVGNIYKVRMDRLELFSLHCQWLSGDLMEVYKMCQAYIDKTVRAFFPRVEMPNTKWQPLR